MKGKLMRMNEHVKRAAWLMMIVAVAVGGLSSRAFGVDTSKEFEPYEQWYVLMMNGQRAGWVCAKRSMLMLPREDGGETFTVRTDMEMAMKIKRGPTELAISMDQKFIEDGEGDPIEAGIDMNMGGGMGLKAKYRFEDDGVVQVTEQLGKAVERKLPKLPDGVKGLAAMERAMDAALKRGDTVVTCKTVDISMGVTVVTAEMTKVGEEVIDVYGKQVPAIAWDVKASNMRGLVMRQYTDESGKALKMMMPIGGGLDMEMIAADKATALSEMDAPEVMAATLLKPMAGSVEVKGIRKSKQAVYELHFKKMDGLDIDIPRTGTQKVVWGDEKRARVIVDLEDENNPEADLPTEADKADTHMLQWKDEVVQSLVRDALGEDIGKGMSDREKASKLRKFVHEYIDEKSLGVGFASAGEVARSKQGDCTEHAVLLAAMMRAAGLPSRVVNGLMYIDQFLGQKQRFGYHAWAMAWIEDEDGGRWVDYDAVLGGRDYDAGHIALMKTSMADDEMSNDLMALLPVMGNVDVKVVRVRK